MRFMGRIGKMGFFRKAFEVFQDVTSLGGTIRMRHWNGRQQELIEIYNRLRIQIDQNNESLVAAVARIKEEVRVSTKHLQRAERMLDPLGESRSSVHSQGRPLGNTQTVPQSRTALAITNRQNATNELTATMAGAGTGTAAALTSWGVVQVGAHASTGTAMAALHGAAAANAGWAWFGGGSLAAGGGGMAAGHLVLPGIGTAIAVAVSATIAHREANRLVEECEKLEGANSTNQKSLSKVDADLGKVRGLEIKLGTEAEKLRNLVRLTRRRLFAFGIFSHFFRLIRFRIRGYYYKSDELFLIDDLGNTVATFLSKFETI